MDGESLPAGLYVEVAVADTGCGMPESVRRKAFEPFFTTREVGDGTGLGLSLVFGFAHQSNGLATLESELGKGTVAKILLPIFEATAESQNEGTKFGSNDDVGCRADR